MKHFEKSVLTLALVLALVLSLAACGAKKTDLPEGEKKTEELPDDKVIDVSGDGEKEDPEKTDGEKEDGKQTDEQPAGPRDLMLDDDPEPAPPDYEKESDRRVVIMVDDVVFEEGIDVFLELDGYEYYFERIQSPYTYVSVDGGPFLEVREAMMTGAVTLNELRLEGLDVKVRPVEEVKPDLSLEVTVVHTEDGFLLGTAMVGEEIANVIVYAENTSRFSAGSVVPISYTMGQLVECDEEIPYLIEPEEEGAEPEHVIFKAAYKLIDAEIYV